MSKHVIRMLFVAAPRPRAGPGPEGRVRGDLQGPRPADPAQALPQLPQRGQGPVRPERVHLPGAHGRRRQRRGDQARQPRSEPALPRGRPPGRAEHAAQEPKIPDADLAVIKKWIEGGAPETAVGAAKTAARKVDIDPVAVSIGKPDGPPPMPEKLPAGDAAEDRAAAPGHRDGRQPVGAAAGRRRARAGAALQHRHARSCSARCRSPSGSRTC